MIEGSAEEWWEGLSFAVQVFSAVRPKLPLEFVNPRIDCSGVGHSCLGAGDTSGNRVYIDGNGPSSEEETFEKGRASSTEWIEHDIAGL